MKAHRAEAEIAHPEGEGCMACKAQPAVRMYVATAEGIEHRVPVCEECYELLIRPSLEKRVS